MTGPEIERLLAVPNLLLHNLDAVWTFFLILARTTGLFMILPGIGGGVAGLVVRYPAMLIISLVASMVMPHAALPGDWILFAAGILSEVVYGFCLGAVPYFTIAGIQMAGQLASTTMGLSGGSLFDPTFGISSTELAKIYSDSAIFFFLYLGGHYLLLYALCGGDAAVAPGQFILDEPVLKLLIDNAAKIYTVGISVSAPIIVALLLAQFVMGLVSRAVPTVNVFIVSFPITAGIGLMLAILSIPNLNVYMQRDAGRIEAAVNAMVGFAKH